MLTIIGFFWRKKQNEKIHQNFVFNFVPFDDDESSAGLFVKQR